VERLKSEIGARVVLGVISPAGRAAEGASESGIGAIMRTPGILGASNTAPVLGACSISVCTAAEAATEDNISSIEENVGGVAGAS